SSLHATFDSTLISGFVTSHTATSFAFASSTADSSSTLPASRPQRQQPLGPATSRSSQLRPRLNP
ncbi:hypothetical protein AAVH_26975, partial [Aphelenchoides avenae]